jgi:hypothetical protein
MRNVFSAIAALLLVSGCASSTPSSQTPGGTPAEHLTVRAPGNFDEVTLQGDRIFSSDVEVTRYGDDYRGKAYRKLIDLRVKDGAVEGIVGSARTALRVQKFPDGFEVNGLYAGHMGRLTVRRDRFEGQLGGRAFQLSGSATDPLVYGSSTEPAAQPAAAVEKSPTGTTAPAPAPDKSKSNWTQFAIPPTLAALPAEHQAAVIAIFIGR